MEGKCTKENKERFIAIRDALDKASSLYPYEVVGNPDTFDQYNAGWQDAVDYLSQLFGVD